MLCCSKIGWPIIPALTLAAHEKSRDAASRILFISSSCALDATIINSSTSVDRQMVLPLYVASMQKGICGFIALIHQVVSSFFKSLFFLWKENQLRLLVWVD